MDQIVFQNISLTDLRGVARKIMETFGHESVFALKGDLGAGKTTLIKAFCLELEVTEDVTSPSFAIVNEYHCVHDELVYHFDFYRIKKVEEVLDIGYEEYLYSGWYCFLEWPEKIQELLPESYVQISIKKNEEDDLRKILVREVQS